LGTSLVAVPFTALQLAVDPDGEQWVTLANPLLIALTGALIVAIGVRLGRRRWLAVAAGLTFGTATMAPQQSTELFSEPGVGLALLSAVYSLMRWRAGATWAPWLLARRWQSPSSSAPTPFCSLGWSSWPRPRS
jgi:hypothetical protein